MADQIIKLMFEHKIAAAAILIVLAVVSWLVTGDGLASAFLARDPRVVAAMIMAGGSIFAVVLGAIVGVIKDAIQKRSERTSVAAALLVEVFSQGDVVAVCGSVANVMEHENKVLRQRDIARLLPPSPAVFPALADRIILLPVEAASSVVSFYGAVTTATQLTALLPLDADEPIVEVQSGTDKIREHEINSKAARDAKLARDRVAQAWRGAAHNAVMAIKSLLPLAPTPKKEDENKKLHELMEQLAVVALKRGWPRVTNTPS